MFLSLFHSIHLVILWWHRIIEEGQLLELLVWRIFIRFLFWIIFITFHFCLHLHLSGCLVRFGDLRLGQIVSALRLSLSIYCLTLLFLILWSHFIFEDSKLFLLSHLLGRLMLWNQIQFPKETSCYFLLCFCSSKDFHRILL